MTNQQWAELLAAINALRPSPWSTLVPVLAGLLGAAFGFFASVARDRYKATTEKRQRIAADLRERRQVAVNALNQAASKWVQRWAGIEHANRSAHHEESSTISLLFVQTGEHSDGILEPAVLRFLNSLEDSVISYTRYAGGGYDPVVETYTQRWDETVEAAYRDIISLVRERSDRWFLHAEPTDRFAEYLDKQAAALNAMKEASLAARTRI